MDQHCRACRAELEHCHGTVIDHPVRGPECTESTCADTESVPHGFAIDCGDIGCTCGEPVALHVVPT